MNPAPGTYPNKFTSALAGWLTAGGIGYTFRAHKGSGIFHLAGSREISIVCADLETQTPGSPHPLLSLLPESQAPAGGRALVIWEDVWYRKTEIVKSRLRALLGLSSRIPARLTRVERIDKPAADHFLESHHMNGSASARYRFGLFLPAKYKDRFPYSPPEGSSSGDDILVAVAAFAAPRLFHRPGEKPYKSGELIRFASHRETTVVGGLSKLTAHFAELYRPDDIVTYVDLEWSDGASFRKAGFEAAGQTEPLTFLVDKRNFNRYPLHRIDNKIIYSSGDSLIRIVNAGNRKYARKFHYPQSGSDENDRPENSPVFRGAPPYDLILVAGPTASGKTALAVRIAYELGGEIISLDSRQVYREMDIGTGKDIGEYTIGDQEIPYHLIDIIPPGTPYSVHHFLQDFQKVFRALKERNKPVIACGGSGLYIEAVLNFLKDEYPGNFRPSLLIIGLNPPVHIRKHRIGTRLKKRLGEGLVEEVKSLIEKGVPEDTLIRYGLEYKYVTLYLRGELPFDEMEKKLLTEICRFSKRQITFLKKVERTGYTIRWL